MKKLLIIAALLALNGIGASADNLEQCLQNAKENYPLAKRYDLLSKSADCTLANISKGWLPQITLSAQATAQSDVVALPDALKSMMIAQGMDYKGISKTQGKVAVDVQQTIWDGGAIAARRDVEKAETETQIAQNEAEIYKVLDRVNNIYYGILLLQEKFEQVDAHIALLQSTEKKLNALKKEGVATVSEVAAIKAELVESEQQKTDITYSKQALLQMLSLFCGKEIKEVSMTNYGTSSAINSASLENRPEWQLLNKQLTTVSAREKLLNASIMPKIGAFAQGYYGYPGFNMYDDMFSRNWSLNGLVGVRIGWNLSALYTHKKDKQKLSVQRDMIENAREILEFNTNQQLTNEQQYAERCKKQLEQDEEAINLRQIVRKAAEAKLDNGIIDVNSLVQEMTREKLARIKRAEHAVEMQQHLAEIKYLAP